MTYTPDHSHMFLQKMKKLRRKDRLRFERIDKKTEEILQNPHHYKPLGNVMAGVLRVHIDPYVLTFEIDEARKVVRFIDFEHHDKAYQN